MVDKGWRECRLADVCDSIDYGYTASAEKKDIGPKFLRITDIVSGYVDWERVPHVDADAATAQKYQLADGDIVIARTGASTGASQFIKEAPEAIFASYLIRLKIRDSIDPRFVSYYLKSEQFWSYIRGVLGDKSAQPNASASTITQAPMLIPEDRLNQERIADILGTIDDKIDLNRRINQTLEQMVCAIFKSWFVDFEPVKAKLRAKVEGRDPFRAAINAITGKTDAILDQLPPEQFDSLVAIAAQFPDELIESELGRIPRGWEITTIGDITERCGGIVQTGPFGSQLHASDYVNSGLPVVMPQDIADRRVQTNKIVRIGEGDAQRLSRHRLQIGDIVFSRRGDVEKHALVSDREQGWLCGTGCLLVRLGPKWPAPAYVSQALDLPTSRAWLRNHAIGATMPNLNTGILSSLPLVIATGSLVQAFQEKVDAIDAYINYNNAQSETLEELRDALLPKLLSGELPIAYADSLE